MSNETTTIIEVNGVKMEVDLRQARVVHENLRVGSKVKVLEKGGYSGPTVYAGVVVGFELFHDFPTIIVAFVKTGYSNPGIEFAYINSKSAEKWDMVPSMDDDLPVQKGDILSHFDREIEKKRAEMGDLEAKRDFFLRHFNHYFSDAAA